MSDDINDNKNNNKLKAIKGGKSGEKPFHESVSTATAPPLPTPIPVDEKPIKSLGVKEHLLIDHFKTGHLHPRMPFGTPNKPLCISTYKPEFGSKKRVIKFDDEKKLVKEIDRDETVEFLENYIGKHFSNPETCTDYGLSFKQIESLTKRFIARANQLKEWPRAIRFKSDWEYCFERHDFDPFPNAKVDQFPDIDYFLKKIENRDALLQIIGSILAGEPIRKLSPILWGAGGTGKSTFYRLLKSLFGKLSWDLVPKDFGKDKFASTFIKDTVAWFSDETTSALLNSLAFKELTGSDSMPVRMMQKDYVKVELQGVFFGNSNKKELLGLSGDSSIIDERILSCKTTGVIPRKMRTIDVWPRLQQQRKFLAGYALDLYEKSGTDLEIKSNYLYDEIVRSSLSELEDIFERYLVRDDSLIKSETRVLSKEFGALFELICEENPKFSRTIGLKDWREFCCDKLELDKIPVRFSRHDKKQYGVPKVRMIHRIEQIIKARLHA